MVESPPNSRKGTLVVLFLVNLLNFYDRQALGAVLEPIRREFRLSDTQLGALITGFTVVYALAGLPLGRLADRGPRKRLLATGVAVWAGLTALGGLAANYLMLMATRLGVGVGEAVCAPVAASWIGDAVPARHRARAMALFMVAVPLGGMLSYSISGPLAQAWGWRAALAVAALPAVGLIPALLMLREPEREPGPAGETPGLRSVLSIGALWWVALSGAVVNFALYSFSTFLPAFLSRVHGLSVARAGVWAGIGSGVAGIAGAAAAGLWGDRVRGAGGRLRLAALAALVAAPVAWCAIAFPAGSAWKAASVLMLAYGLLQMYYGLVYAAIQDLVEPTLRGTAMAAYFVVTYLGGAAFGPLLTGRLSDHFARAASGTGPITEAARAVGLHQAMFVIPVLSAVLAAVLWQAGRAATARAELARS